MLVRVLVAVSALIWAVSAVQQSSSAQKLNVHLVMHTHDDPGWLKTADQYYTGANASVYLASVQYIFDSVVTELQKDPQRHFTFCEISFLSRWYYEQSAQVKSTFKSLVKNGQIAIVNGGWVMHDEAAAHYMSMIDQTTLGHKFLKDELNYIPRVGWQIDPFGHSNTHAWLSSAVGFDALYFGRIDYQDRAKRMSEKNMEMVWKGSNSDQNQYVFTGAFTSGNYGAPSGYCFDSSCHYCRNDPVIDSEYLEGYNVDTMTDGFIDAILQEQSTSRGNNIMLKMGADFTHDNANTWFKNVDKLIKYVNEKDERFNLFYSDPVMYTQARAQENIVWSTKTDDFFPYSDHEHAFWAGYFTSRPTLKYFERTSSALLQAVKQLASPSALRSFRKDISYAINKFTAAVGLVNHHDAITGTSKQHVAYDYIKILDHARTIAERLLSNVVVGWFFSQETHISVEQTSSATSAFGVCRLLNETVCDISQSSLLQAGDSIVLSVYNPLSRAQSQPITVPLNAASSAGFVVVYRMQTEKESGELVLEEVSSDALPNLNMVTANSAPRVLSFVAEGVPSTAIANYLIIIASNSDTGPRASESKKLSVKSSGDTLTISTDTIAVAFDSNSGLMESISRLDVESDNGGTLSAKVSQDLGFYKAFGSPGVFGPVAPKDERDPHLKNIQPLTSKDSSDSQPSGAYIFRSASADEIPTRIADSNSNNGKVSLTVNQGQTMIEVQQKFNTYASQIVRIRVGDIAAEIEWTVGPVPINDGIGKEIISKFNSDLSTGGDGSNVFYTDSNGREFLQRKFNYRPTWDLEVYEPIAGNYYPLSTAMYIQDEQSKRQLSLLLDRSEAGASLANGEMELLIHRRLVVDDNRGVEEPLNETVGGMSPYPDWIRYGEGITVTGKHYLLLSNLKDGMREMRGLMDSKYSALIPFFTSSKVITNSVKKTAKWTRQGATINAPSTHIASPSLITEDLPMNVQLVTLERLDDSQVLIRLAHQFAVGEDPTLSQPVTVDLFNLLNKDLYGSPSSAIEWTLSANQEKSAQLAEKIQWSYDNGTASSQRVSSKAVEFQRSSLRNAQQEFNVDIYPMEIRTFVLQFAAK